MVDYLISGALALGALGVTALLGLLATVALFGGVIPLLLGIPLAMVFSAVAILFLSYALAQIDNLRQL